MSKHLENGGRAVIEDDSVVIRYPFAAFQSALDGSWGMNKIDQRWKVTDPQEFAKSFCHSLNKEDEQGTTMVHEMADKAFVEMIEWGEEGIDLHEDQEMAHPKPAHSIQDRGVEP